MDAVLFESLIYEEEGLTLDFKRDQYRFVKASLDDKSEILKDLLGFANALRRTEAYILIGVQDVRGGRAKVVGITDHLDDHSLQQFVAHNTNRTVRFHYEAFTFEGASVGIIRIDTAQDRPLSTTRDMGVLRKGEVYLRRGSCTDPTKPATADEIALMGRASAMAIRRSELQVQFADVDRDTAIGTTQAWEAMELRTPAASKIPSYSIRQSFPHIGYNQANPNFYREVAAYTEFQSLFRPVRLVVENTGATAAEDVRVELELDKASGVSLKEYEPSEPTRTLIMGMNTDHLIHGIRRPIKEPGDVSVVESKESARLEVDCGNMQPGRKVWSEKFYVAVRESGPTWLSGRILAATLEQPKPFTLTIDATITEADAPVEAIKKFADETFK